MDRRVWTLVLALALLAAASGCIEPDGRELTLEPLPEIQNETTGFEYDGRVALTGFGSNCVENVTVSLYHANTTRMGSESVGTLCYENDSTIRTNVTLATNRQPAYIVVDSPELWNEGSGVDAVGYSRNSEHGYYMKYPIESRDQVRPTGDIAEPVPVETTSETTDAIPVGGFVVYVLGRVR